MLTCSAGPILYPCRDTKRNKKKSIIYHPLLQCVIALHTDLFNAQLPVLCDDTLYSFGYVVEPLRPQTPTPIDSWQFVFDLLGPLKRLLTFLYFTMVVIGFSHPHLHLIEPISRPSLTVRSSLSVWSVCWSSITLEILSLERNYAPHGNEARHHAPRSSAMIYFYKLRPVLYLRTNNHSSHRHLIAVLRCRPCFLDVPPCMYAQLVVIGDPVILAPKFLRR